MSLTLAQITRELLSAYGRFPRKRLGQHFLVDPKVLERILGALQLNAEDLVIEIGSGLGVVTAEMAEKVNQLIAIEIDKELLKISQEVLSRFKNITFIAQDILKTDLASLAQGKSYKVMGNLPYYITAPIIQRILEAENKPELAVLMTQKEVAERMAAAPGSKQYGSFSIFVQYYADVRIDSLVSKSSFHPWPEVSSAIVVLKPYKTLPFMVRDQKLFFDLVHAAFQQRRKKIRNSLDEYNLENSGVDLNQRPEQLTISDFARLANFIAAQKP